MRFSNGSTNPIFLFVCFPNYFSLPIVLHLVIVSGLAELSVPVTIMAENRRLCKLSTRHCLVRLFLEAEFLENQIFAFGEETFDRIFRRSRLLLLAGLRCVTASHHFLNQTGAGRLLLLLVVAHRVAEK